MLVPLQDFSSAPAVNEYWGRRNVYKPVQHFSSISVKNAPPPFLIHMKTAVYRVQWVGGGGEWSLSKTQLLYFGLKLIEALNILASYSLQKQDHNYLQDYGVIFCSVWSGGSHSANQKLYFVIDSPQANFGSSLKTKISVNTFCLLTNLGRVYPD